MNPAVSKYLTSSRLAPYVLLIVAILLAYANVYQNAFLFDDLDLIAGNKFLTSWHYIGTLCMTDLMAWTTQHHGPFYRPLQMLLYLFVYQIFGPSTVAFHLLNVVLHMINACLLYRLGIRLGFQRIAALLTALLWALHPVHTEAVSYMSGTADPLCGMFLLSGILVLAQGVSSRRVATACLLFMLALLSKETSVVFPLLAMGLLFYRSEKRWAFRTYLKTWPFWAMAALYLLLRMSDLFSGYYHPVTADVTSVDRFYTIARLYTFLATLPAYLRIIVWPTGLHMGGVFAIYMTFWTPQVLAGCAILTVVIGCIFWKPAQRATPLAWGMLWAVALHIPQSNLLVRANGLFYEHWLYLPTMGLMLGAGESLARLVGYAHTRWFRPALGDLGILMLCILGSMTLEQNKIWRDSIALYSQMFASGDSAPVAHYNLGTIYLDKGQNDLALEQFRTALAANDYYVDAHYNLGVVLLRIDQSPATIAEAAQHFERAIELDPGYYKAYEALGAVYAYLGDQTKEAEYQAKATMIRKKLGIE